MPPRSTWILGLVLTFCLAFVPSAWAVDPPSARQTIVSADFNADDGGFVLAEIDSERQAAAGWGRISNVRRGTSGFGLWCAGTQFYPTVVTPSPFWSSQGQAYPAAYYYMFQELREEIVLTGTTAKALKYAGVGTVSNIEVWNAPIGGSKYRRDDDYIVGLNAQGFTTIARSGSLPGTTIPNGSKVYVDYRWPSAGTRGSAALDLPQLAEYYRSWVSFHYLMPSVGTDDSFTFHWKETGTVGANESYRFPVASAWKSEQRQISAGNTVSLSRLPATLWFQFFDMTAGAGGLPNGQGPAIDDFAVTGMKYGPVDPSTISTAPGNAIPVAVADNQASYVGTATIQLSGIDSGQLKLVWGPPRLTPTDPSADTREMSYRVWRKSGAAWTELTSEADRVAVREIPEAAAPGVYTYAVQAWDPVGQGSAYGEVAEKALTVGSAPSGSPIGAIQYSLDDDATQTVQPAETCDVVAGPRAEPHTLRFRVKDSDANWSPTRTIVFAVNASTAFSSLSGDQRLNYGAAGALSGTLKSGGGALGAKTVTLQRLSGRTSGSWIDVSSKPTDANGYVRFDIPASSSGYDYTKTYYRLSFAGAPGYAGSPPSASRYIDPQAYVGTPWSSKSTVYHRKSYTWYASLKPRHSGKPVKLYFERYSRGKYRPYKTVYASAYNYSSYSRVKAKYSIPYAGKWRVRAYHDDAGHLPAYSKWLYKRVR